MRPDHVHMLLSIPPAYAVAHIMGCIKGKSAIHMARTCMGKRRNSTGQHVWAHGYDVSTVGREESSIRESSRKQEGEDTRLDQMGLGNRHLKAAHLGSLCAVHRRGRVKRFPTATAGSGSLMCKPPAVPEVTASLHCTLQQRLTTREVFPNDDALVQVLSLAWPQVATKWTCPMRDWKAALHPFVIVSGERVLV